MIQRLLKSHSLLKKFLSINISLQIMVIEALFLTAIARFLILNVEFKKLNKKLGNKGVETSMSGVPKGYVVAKKISVVVNKVADITPWESKCLVRAMTAQKMMKRRGYGTTLYLGVGKDDEGMNAHAWLRYGVLYLTGGTGSSHAKVAQFSTEGINDSNM